MEENQLQQSVGYSQISMEYPGPDTALYTLPRITNVRMDLNDKDNTVCEWL